MNFSTRHREDELMDDMQLSAHDLKLIYDDINRANSFLGGTNGLISAVTNLISKNPKNAYSLIDVGCGDGEMLRKLCLYFRSKNLEVSLIGMDLNEKAIALAEASSKDFPEISYSVLDVLSEDITALQADLVVSTLTMHHIKEEAIPLFLKRLCEMARIGIVINDLQRSRLAYYLFKFFSAIFIKTKEAKNDGLVSIRSGFTKKELLHYSHGLSKFDHSIQSKWAFRYVWIMQPNRLN